MTRDDLIKRIAEKNAGISLSDSRELVLDLFESMKSVILEGESLEIRRFGVFEIHHRKPRIARNPRTGEKVSVGERKSLIFRPGKILKLRMKNLTRKSI
ncbi:HU family DNA-binding protein [Leptospirillum ferriphilum]|jgi:integration host factor subunit beta|uniref:Integration host factor subunit beta n=4 Tax=Leptospirillum TaxID=179 RepID=A0A059XYR9_9BACT|nr:MULTISPECIES: HU family DNA-binding protein [Leptospirillum]EAY57172.1 MAG: putative integration host factor, beta-subunit [Leptospirillum rubarum]EDZ38763.1 MAG: Putative integration host factor, beta-subunit [Leptospirillum sp. Group II '5-way CG']EIJ77172.1 MAG: Putative integration host factor, beta-subunit [Leptospirillum sp. Group II 'C75']MCL5259960.1 integration host factor subunit beta [Nitrospirota bacterium]AFS53324.1 putative integration host factor, beta-subunit [Leptospirillum